MVVRLTFQHLAVVVACILVVSVPSVARATIVPDAGSGDGIDPGVVKDFSECVQRFNSSGFGDLLNQLTRSGHTWVVKRRMGNSESRPDSEADANKEADGTDNKGSGGVIFWDPTNFDVFESEPGFVTREKCATLYHEMAHAVNSDKGIRDKSPCFTIKDGKVVDTNMDKEEVNAIEKENAYRRGQRPPLPERTNHGKKEQFLPPANVGCLPKKPEDPKPAPPPPAGCAAGCAIGAGEPHLRTFDALDYDLQAVGEFVLALAPEGLQLQGRMIPVKGLRTVSFFSAVAASVATDRIGIYRRATGLAVRVNEDAAPVDLASGSLQLQGGGEVTRYSDESVSVIWPDKSMLVVRPVGTQSISIQLQLSEGRKGSTEGLFGNNDGHMRGDLVVRNGSALPAEPSFDQLYKSFADSWRVTQETSLFHYAQGENTETFTDRSFPDRQVTADSLPNRAFAEALCQRAGVVEPTLLKNCILDVGLTGEIAYATDAVKTQRLLAAGSGTTLAITRPGARAELTFEGVAGQKVFVDVPESTLDDECSVITLRDPADASLASGCIISGVGYIDATVLPSTGRYTVRLESGERRTGVASVQVVTAIDQGATIAADGPAVIADINQAGAVSRFTFSGLQGQKVFVDVSSSTLRDECGVLSLLDEMEHRLADGCIIAGAGFIDGTVLPADGQYAVLVDPGDRITGTATLNLINSVDQSADIRIAGPEVVARVGQPGAVSRLAFDGTQGQQATVEISGATLPDECSPIQIRDPDGASLASSCVINGSGRTTATLPTSGRFTVVVDPGGRATGTARIKLHN